MNIQQFKDKVQVRILSEFLIKFKKPKMDLFHKVVYPLSVVLQGTIWGLLLSFNPQINGFIYVVLTVFVFGLFIMNHNFVSNIKAYFNFKKSSDKYFGTLTSSIPFIESNEELVEFVEKTNSFYSKRKMGSDFYSLEFTSKELEEFKNLELNEKQKNKIIALLKKKNKFDYRILEPLYYLSDEYNLKVQKREIENIKEQSQLVKQIGFNHLLQMEPQLQASPKFKLKDLL